MSRQDEQSEVWARLVGFLGDAQGRSKEEVHRDLAADGVNVPAFLARVRETVRKGVQAELKRRAKTEMATDDERLENVRREVGLMSLDRLHEIMASTAAGKFGNGVKDLAIAARNATGDGMSEPELRACVEDILLASDDRPGSKAG